RFANGIQEIPFEINLDIVDLLSKIIDEGGGIFGVPLLRNPEEPPFPLREDWSKEGASEEELSMFSKWKYDMVKYYETMKELTQKRREITSFFQTVRDGYTKVYFPVFFDFRGRMYYNANPSPQGSDIARSCLNFHKRKPLGSRGLFWLKVHLANSLGVDNVRFNARVEYVDSILDTLIKALDDPIANSDAFGDEAPMSAYITTLEIKRALESGDIEAYECNVPVHMDATVSGTQHFSALLRDPVGAEYTNLIDLGQTAKADMYMRVADVALNNMKVDVSEHSVVWLEKGLPRDLVKKPVMTYTYGVTKDNVCKHVSSWVSEQMGVNIARTGVTFRDAMYLTNRIFEGIAETIPATVTGMEFLQDVARELGTTKMSWTTPSGFWVYFDAKN
ncbi:MAG: DNA-directed RNA polymerase, partial [Bacteroides sp.]